MTPIKGLEPDDGNGCCGSQGDNENLPPLFPQVYPAPEYSRSVFAAWAGPIGRPPCRRDSQSGVVAPACAGFSFGLRAFHSGIGERGNLITDKLLRITPAGLWRGTYGGVGEGRGGAGSVEADQFGQHGLRTPLDLCWSSYGRTSPSKLD